MDQPDIVDSAGQAYHVCGWAYNRGYGQRLTDKHLAPAEIFGPSGSSGFYRRTALDRTGPLLPEYGAYFEDTDLAFRLRWAGYRSIYEPGSRVLHRGHSSYGTESDRVVRLLARNEELAYWINLPTRDLLWSLPAHLGFLAVPQARPKTPSKAGFVLICTARCRRRRGAALPSANAAGNITSQLAAGPTQQQLALSHDARRGRRRSPAG